MASKQGGVSSSRMRGGEGPGAPQSLGPWEVDGGGGGALRRDRLCHERGSTHKLIVKIERALVGRELDPQRTHCRHTLRPVLQLTGREKEEGRGLRSVSKHVVAAGAGWWWWWRRRLRWWCGGGGGGGGGGSGGGGDGGVWCGVVCNVLRTVSGVL